MSQKIPQHVAMIMDGNGRWAEQRGLSRSEGHQAGVGVVKEMVKGCLARRIPVLSVWAFGSENWARPKVEIDFLMQLFLATLKSEINQLHENGVQLNFTGDREQLSALIQQEMQSAETLTAPNTQLRLNVVFNYGGKWDLVNAAQTLASRVLKGELAVTDITEQTFAAALSMQQFPEPDLFIRTSGEQRISNFFLWQLAYTELYFTDVLWPDFTEVDLDKALIFFNSRERRFGKTSQQLHNNCTESSS